MSKSTKELELETKIRLAKEEYTDAAGDANKKNIQRKIDRLEKQLQEAREKQQEKQEKQEAQLDKLQSAVALAGPEGMAASAALGEINHHNHPQATPSSQTNGNVTIHNHIQTGAQQTTSSPQAPQSEPKRKGIFKNIWSSGKAFLKNFKSKELEDYSSGGVNFLFFWIILVHIWDAFFLGFQIDAASYMARLVAYFSIMILAFFILKQPALPAIKEYVGVSLFPLVLFPLLITLLEVTPLSIQIIEYMQVVLMFIPVWLIYLIWVKGVSTGWISKVSKWYFVAWVIFGFMILLVNIGTIVETQGVQTSGINPKEAWGAIVELSVNVGRDFGAGILGIRDVVTGDIDRRINESLGRDYQADIDNSRDRSGVFLENLGGPQRQTEGRSVRLFADFRAVAYDRPFEAEFRCHAKNRNGDIFEGVASPQELTIQRSTSRSIFCDFEGNNALPEGRYDVELFAKFEFETWAYTEYTFVSADAISNYIETRNLADWNRRYNVNPQLRSEHSGGPVFLGARQVENMPVPVYTDEDTYFLLGFGAENRQRANGRLVKINNFEFRMPKAISLSPDMCSIGYENVETAENDAYNLYTFPNIDGLDTLYRLDCTGIIMVDDVDEITTGTTDPFSPTIVSTIYYDYELVVTRPLLIEEAITFEGNIS